MTEEIVITGIKSNISQNFIKLLGEVNIHGIRVESIQDYLWADKYLFCQGVLYPKREDDQSEQEKDNSKFVNFQSIADACDKILTENSKARICIIGSESGYRGSFDGSYAKYKKMIHEYIETAPIQFPTQQIVGLAPTIIEDTAMTQNRKDHDNINRRRQEHPLKRFLYSNEVSSMAYTLLYQQPYINKTVIRMHGGMNGN